MTTTEQRLADALRALEGHMRRVHDGYPPSTASHAVAADREAAREALAAYDAQQAVTPGDGPWSAEDYAVSNGECGVCIKDGDDTVLDLPFMPAWPESVQRARAARIVQCVNAHDALVSALQACQRVLDDNGGTTPQQWIDAEAAARAALAQAGAHHA